MDQDPAFQYPADLKKAERHRLASRVFKSQKVVYGGQEKGEDTCQCCGLVIGDKKYKKPFFYSTTKDLWFLGAGAPLFFTFIIDGLIYLTIFGLIFVIYAMLTNVQGNSCNDANQCSNDFFNSISLSNKIDDTDGITTQIYLISAFFLIYIVLKHFFIYRIRKADLEHDRKLLSPSDFAIIIKELPENIKEKDIEKMLEEKRAQLTYQENKKTNQLKVKKIILSYDVGEYTKKKIAQEERFKSYAKVNGHQNFEKLKLLKPFKTGNFAIVVFQRQQSKYVVQKGGYTRKICNFSFLTLEEPVQYQVKDKPVIVKRAPEPNDILWYNSNIDQSTKIVNIVLAFILGAIILVIGAIIQYFLKYFDYLAKGTQFGNFYVYLSPVILFIYDEMIVEILQKTTTTQGHPTQTDLYKSLLIKVSYYSFLNVGVFFLISQFFAYKSKSFNLLGGFAFDLFNFFVVKTLSIPVVKFLKTWAEFPTCIKRWMLRCGLKKCTQKQANKLYEPKLFNFAVKYSYVVKTIWIALFYAPFLPIIVPIAIVGLIFFYFSEKNLLRTSYKRPRRITAEIAQTATRLIDYGALILLAGQFLVLIYIKYVFQVNWQDWTPNEIASLSICLFLAFFILFAPAFQFNKYILPFKKVEEKVRHDDDYQELIDYFDKAKDQLTYSEAERIFTVTYESTNPYKWGNRPKKS